MCFSKAIFSHLGTILGPFCGHLGESSCHLGAILGPFWAMEGQARGGKEGKRKRQANDAKIAQRLGEGTIFHVLGSSVKAFWGPLWGHLGLILGSLQPRHHPRRAEEDSKWPKMAVSGLRGPLYDHRGAIWGSSWRIFFGAILAHLGGGWKEDDDDKSDGDNVDTNIDDPTTTTTMTTKQLTIVATQV